ncbi:HEAT repeat domain-containing protein [Lachnoanaerobaculum gingivalis]|uniref:HEAT repeat domain-containing protein n=1 Tax=Lachnoanaerobaculum gingivalis TaxID=2490855 RepID=A0A3P3R1A9_9FIRM|nr:HEAT repeat domain-containing protein [Lachnoanaerobaculum gingivalis]RRJ26788.1 HEAT repeat domain-containing protein [Lachnoanaerobaculum gingivalis]
MDFKKRYEELKKQNFPDSERIKFIADLGASEEIEYHYQLICTDRDEGTNLNLSGSFYKHDKKGLEFLFEVLDNEDNENLKVFIAYLMAETLSKLRHRDFYVEFCNKLIPVMTSLIETKDAILRQKIIISLGWIGSSNEIDIFTKKISEDKDSLCRAWSASSLMQMSFHGVGKKLLQEKTKAYFASAIASETDLYACGIMIESAQILFGKKWISSSAVEDVDAEKIEKARKSAVRFLNK